jgi:hypothetical protein
MYNSYAVSDLPHFWCISGALVDVCYERARAQSTPSLSIVTRYGLTVRHVEPHFYKVAATARGLDCLSRGAAPGPCLDAVPCRRKVTASLVFARHEGTEHVILRTREVCVGYHGIETIHARGLCVEPAAHGCHVMVSLAMRHVRADRHVAYRGVGRPGLQTYRDTHLGNEWLDLLQCVPLWCSVDQTVMRGAPDGWRPLVPSRGCSRWCGCS